MIIKKLNMSPPYRGRDDVGPTEIMAELEVELQFKSIEQALGFQRELIALITTTMGYENDA